MRTIPLGRSAIQITDYCLGTMTFGTQTEEADAHRQLSRAAEAGITILDTAEMYPVNPVAAETVGLTETVIGNWIAKDAKHRDAYRIATKISGLNDGFVRPGHPISGATFRQAFEGSLKRLRTDYIDLYQLHWPNRGHYHFRRNWTYDPRGQTAAETRAHIVDVLSAAQDLIAAGKLGAIGLSNETAWGTTQWVAVAEAEGLPRVVSIQNEYSLMCRLYDTDLAEVAANEDVVLLAYSPLAGGMLTGKYQGGAVPEGSRMSRSPGLFGRANPRGFEATQAYLDIAARHGIDPLHMALAFSVQRPFPVSTIFGASSEAQLIRILDGLDVTLEDEVLQDIDDAHRQHPMPY
ncbi:MAG: aldo/keto reductase [Pseudomonadota bacterium]